ncbi:ASCH domain-containing protein [Streptomyces sp. NPDC006872]|uniref:ASCH domain-containing protein n=1 Tax=Streptomyces sp. NPDC006872 TaxID=3155720 RepID=UPI0033DC5DB7
MKPFIEMTWQHAGTEGEGDASLEEWRAGHRRYWSRIGTPVDDHTPVVCLAFRLAARVCRASARRLLRGRSGPRQSGSSRRRGDANPPAQVSSLPPSYEARSAPCPRLRRPHRPEGTRHHDPPSHPLANLLCPAGLIGIVYSCEGLSAERTMST